MTSRIVRIPFVYVLDARVRGRRNPQRFHVLAGIDAALADLDPDLERVGTVETPVAPRIDAWSRGGRRYMPLSPTGIDGRRPRDGIAVPMVDAILDRPDAPAEALAAVAGLLDPSFASGEGAGPAIVPEVEVLPLVREVVSTDRDGRQDRAARTCEGLATVGGRLAGDFMRPAARVLFHDEGIVAASVAVKDARAFPAGGRASFWNLPLHLCRDLPGYDPSWTTGDLATPAWDFPAFEHFAANVAEDLATRLSRSPSGLLSAVLPLLPPAREGASRRLDRGEREAFMTGLEACVEAIVAFDAAMPFEARLLRPGEIQDFRLAAGGFAALYGTEGCRRYAASAVVEAAPSA